MFYNFLSFGQTNGICKKISNLAYFREENSIYFDVAISSNQRERKWDMLDTYVLTSQMSWLFSHTSTNEIKDKTGV